MEQQKPMLQVDNIKSKYGKKEILHGIWLTVERGQCIGIVGPNGCGKSTFIKILAGILKPTTGSISYYGYNPLKQKDVFCKMAGYVPQEDPLLPDLSVYDNLRMWYSDKKTLDKELESGFLSILGIKSFQKKKVRELSGGMKKRVNIAAALAGMPPVLLMDEPSAALDVIAKNDIRNYLKAYLKRNGTVIITTHEDGELELCDRVYKMQNGHLIEIDRSLRGEALAKEFDSGEE